MVFKMCSTRDTRIFAHAPPHGPAAGLVLKVNFEVPRFIQAELGSIEYGDDALVANLVRLGSRVVKEGRLVLLQGEG